MTKIVKSIYCGTVLFSLFVLIRNFIPVNNMLFYVMACAFFVVGAALSYLILEQRKESDHVMGNALWTVLPVGTLIIWLILFYINETNLAPEQSLNESALIRRSFPFPVWASIVLAGVLVCLFALRFKLPEKMKKIKLMVRIIISLAFTFGTAIQFYAPNIFQDIRGGTYHSHAYTNSIINACWLIPYSEHNQSLYGHYGILFMPILKALHRILGIDYLTGIFFVCAVLAGISILAFIWVINHYAENDSIFYLGMFAIGEYYFMLMQGGVFLQVHPHRMIFPIIVVALALYEHKKRKKYNVLAIILITLSVIWSTEVGLVLMVAFALYRWMQDLLCTEKVTFSSLTKVLWKFVLYAGIPFIASCIIVNGYNMIAGGELLNLEEFLFPLISERGYIGNIELPLPDITHAWIGASVLFLGMVCVALRAILMLPGEKEAGGEMPFFFLIGMMGLGLMLYYINRPVEGSLFIIMYLMLIIQVTILQKTQNKYIAWKQNKEPVLKAENGVLVLTLRVVTTMILFIMAFDSIYSMPKAWRTSAETIWKREELQEFAHYVWIQVPPDAVSFGEGVPELLSMIDRDTHMHTTEWSYRNTPKETMKKVRYEIDGEKWIFCSLLSLSFMQEEYPGLTDNYELNEVFEYNDVEFGFWVKKE